MKKRGKKVVSLLLAATLTCSTVVGAATAFAAENADVTYEASYSMTAPKSTYTGLLADANKVLADAAYTTSTLGTVWNVVFSLSGFVGVNGTDLTVPETYATADPDLFGGLAAFMEENNYANVTADVITEYTAAHPELITSAEAFADSVDRFATFLVTAGNNNLQVTLNAVFGLGFLFGLNNVNGQIDNIVRALGFDPGAGIQAACSGSTLQDYLKPILDGLFPNTTVGLMNVLKSVAVPANQVLLYDNLNGLVTQLIPALDRLGSLLGDVSAIKGPLEQIQNLPTTKIIVDGEAKTVYDINALLDMLINDVLVPMVGEQLGADVVATIEQVLVDLGLEDLKLVSFDGSKAVLKFDAVNTANLANAADAEDALNVILHYLYTNLNKTQNKLVLSAVNGIASLVNVLPAEVSTILNAVLKQSEPDAVATIAAMLAKLANRNPVTAVTIEQGENVVLSAGKNGNMYTGSVQLTAVVTPDNATNKDITWSSNIENVTVDANGLVSYKGTLDVPFDATITATAVGGASDTITVHIEKASVTGVSLDTVYAELNEGATLKLNAKVAPANAENKDVTWSTDNEAVATVAADGTVTAVAPGTAKITVTTVDGGLTAICVVEVRADKTALNALLDKVAGMELVEENYDADKWAAYEAALDAAEATAAEELATQAEVNAAVAALNAALKALPVGTELTEVKIVSTSDTLEGNVIYHKVPWYKTWMSQTVDLALEYTEGAEIVSVQWQAANWSIDDPEAKIENADNDSATIRPTFGIGTRSFWVQAVVTDVNGNVVPSDPVKVRFYNWDWQK